MKPGTKESVLHKAGIVIAPQPTKYNNGLTIKITRNGKPVKGSGEKTYPAKECYAQIEIITDFYYERLTKKL